MPLGGETCAKCGATETRAAAWYGEPGGDRACHRRGCQRHIGVPSAQLKRKQAEPGAAAVLELRRPANTTLVEINEILGQRFVDPAELADWQLANDVEEDDEAVEFLVQATFQRHARDKKGITTICWLAVEEMLEGDAAAADVNERLQAYGKRCASEVRSAAQRCA